MYVCMLFVRRNQQRSSTTCAGEKKHFVFVYTRKESEREIEKKNDEDEEKYCKELVKLLEISNFLDGFVFFLSL